MTNTIFTVYIRDKLKWNHIITFASLMLFVGFWINGYEPYPLFYILCPMLLFMMSLTLVVLKLILKEINDHSITCSGNSFIKEALSKLLPDKTNTLTVFGFVLMVLVYFICLYHLNYFTLNLMGIYIFFLGGCTFFIALISYELYIQLTRCLIYIEKGISHTNVNYDYEYPKHTLWLKYVYHLSMVTRIAAFCIGLLFVMENALLFWANFNPVVNSEEMMSWTDKLKNIPLELAVIWLFIFIAIALAFPVIGIKQMQSFKKIVSYIECDFRERIINDCSCSNITKNPCCFYSLLQSIKFIENSLDEAYLPKRSEKILSVSASILTCLIHLVSFYSFIF